MKKVVMMLSDDLEIVIDKCIIDNADNEATSHNEAVGVVLEDYFSEELIALQKERAEKEESEKDEK